MLDPTLSLALLTLFVAALGFAFQAGRNLEKRAERERLRLRRRFS